LLSLVLLATGAHHPANDAAPVEGISRELRERVLASVVGMRAKLPTPVLKFSGRRKVKAEVSPSEGTGSGIVVDRSGLILTCAHLLPDSGAVRVFLHDDREVAGTILAHDRTSDLALVRVEAGPLPALDLSAGGHPGPGATIHLASRPGGASVRFRTGTLASAGLYHIGHSQLEFFRQFVGSVEPGDSGGAIVDQEGRLVGIVSVGLPDGKVGYAIAREFVMIALDRLRGRAPVVWPWLGIALETPPGSPEVVVWSVASGSPAEAVGVRPGHRIVSIDGREVTDIIGAMFSVVSRPIGARFSLQVLGGGAASPRTVGVISTLRPVDPLLSPLDLFERWTGARLEVIEPSAGKEGFLRAAEVRPREGLPPRAFGVGSKLVAIVPGLGLVRALEEGRSDQALPIACMADLERALKASLVGESLAASLHWEKDGRRTTMFLSGEARRDPVL
jgi:S1-C subfamily serine protease